MTWLSRSAESGGSQDFLRPPPLESLLGAAAGGPVVIVNVSQWRCDALIVTTRRRSGGRAAGPERGGGRPAHHSSSWRVLQDAQPAAPGCRSTGPLRPARGASAERDQVLRSTTEWLWDAIAEPVLTALGSAGPADLVAPVVVPYRAC